MSNLKFVVDVELSLTMEELEKLRQLSEIWKCSVEQTARDCMISKCKEELLANLFEKVDKKCNAIVQADQANQDRKAALKDKLTRETNTPPINECKAPADQD